jgi:hypothetical protein
MLIVGKYTIYLHSVRNRPEQLTNGTIYFLFLKLQIIFIFTDNVRILFMYTTVKDRLRYYS